MKQKSKVREYSEYKKVLVFQWFFLLERLPLMDAKAAINGIQEVSGSIPLISTINRPQGQRLAVLLYPSPVTSRSLKKQVNLQFTCFFCLMKLFLIRICALHQHN